MNASCRDLLDGIAELLEYPGIGFDEKIELARRVAGSDASKAVNDSAVADTIVKAAQELGDFLEATGKSGAEERFTRLFDLSPVCTLNVGYHLFGDAYGRGELLAGLVGEMLRRDIPLGDEIPDHLPLLLRLLGRTEDSEDRAILLAMILRPGLDKIKQELTESSDPWSALLRALSPVLEYLVPDAGPSPELPVNAELHAPSAGQEVFTRA